MNSVTIIGNLGSDVEIRNTNGGGAVANLRIATSMGKGESQVTEWHNVVLFGKQAEIAGEHLGKGFRVLIQGRLQHRKYQDKDGNDRFSTETVASTMKFMAKGGGSVNRIAFVGNLGADPETGSTKSGKAVANFRLATNEQYRDSDGASQSHTEWHRSYCQIWCTGHQAAILIG